jgi:short subunit fatty acids transporter
METNYFIISLALIVALIVIILLILKNKKDLKEFESKLNNQDIDPEHHKEEKI